MKILLAITMLIISLIFHAKVKELHLLSIYQKTDGFIKESEATSNRAFLYAVLSICSIIVLLVYVGLLLYVFTSG